MGVDSLYVFDVSWVFEGEVKDILFHWWWVVEWKGIGGRFVSCTSLFDRRSLQGVEEPVHTLMDSLLAFLHSWLHGTGTPTLDSLLHFEFFSHVKNI